MQEPERKKAEKNHSLKESHKCTGGEVGESSKDAAHNKKESSKKKKKSSSSGKLPEQPHCGKVGVSACCLHWRKVWFVLC